MIYTNQKHPTKPGIYLWQPSENHIELIQVFETEPTYHGGVRFDSYLAVAGMSRRNVLALVGTFSKPLQITPYGLVEL